MATSHRLTRYAMLAILIQRLFVLKNKGWESLQAMNDVDGGYDVRVYDSTMSCVYAAHTKYIENWIGKTPIVAAPGNSEKDQEEFERRKEFDESAREQQKELEEIQKESMQKY